MKKTDREKEKHLLSRKKITADKIEANKGFLGMKGKLMKALMVEKKREL